MSLCLYLLMYEVSTGSDQLVLHMVRQVNDISRSCQVESVSDRPVSSIMAKVEKGKEVAWIGVWTSSAGESDNSFPCP